MWSWLQLRSSAGLTWCPIQSSTQVRCPLALGVSWELGVDCQLEHLGPVGAFFVGLGLPEAWLLDPRSSNHTKAGIARLLTSTLRSYGSDVCAAPH